MSVVSTFSTTLVFSQRANMLETDLLTKAFRAFDKEGKGFITEADLRRVLTSDLGERGVSGGELRAWLEGAAEYDREGRRVTYGSFVRMMAHSVKSAHAAGEYVLKQGDAPTQKTADSEPSPV